MEPNGELKRHPIDFTKGAAKIAHAIVDKEAGDIRVRARGRKKSATPAGIEPEETLLQRIDRTLAAPEVPEHVPKPQKPKVEKVPNPICSRPKKNGQPCSSRSMNGKTYCTDHRPAIDQLNDAERLKFQGWLGRSVQNETLALDIVEAWGWGQVREFIRRVL